MGAGRVFGFAGAHGDDRTVVVEDEAAIIREVATRMLAGEPLMTLAAELNQRGIHTASGKTWTGANLGRLLGQHRMGGNIELKGRIVGRIPGRPILDRETYEALQALLVSRRRGKRATGRFMLTGLAVCTRCGHTMNGATSYRDGRRMYRCPPNLGGCGMAVDAAKLEALVDEHMVGVLSDPKLASKIAAKDTEVSAARLGCLHEIENVEQQLVDLEVKNAERPLVPRAYTAARDVLDRRLDKAKAALAEVGAAPSPALDPRADWNALDGDDKRTMIRRFEVNIHVDAPTAPVRRWQPERVHID